MGKKKIKKVVLDTNILVSALLLKGDLSKIVDLPITFVIESNGYTGRKE